MGKYLDDARSLYRQALEELARYEQTQNSVILRDASEKAWGAVTQAANDVIDHFGMAVPSGTGIRRQRLREATRQHRQLEPLFLESRFSDAENALHKECFYDGNCPVPYISDKIIDDVQRFLSDVESIARPQGRRSSSGL